MKGMVIDMKNTVDLHIKDKIYIYQILNPEYKFEKLEPVQIKKQITFVENITTNRYGEIKLCLIDEATGIHYATIQSKQVNQRTLGSTWKNEFYSTVENDDFFKDFFDETRQELHKQYLNELAWEKRHESDYHKRYTEQLRSNIKMNGINAIFGKMKMSFSRYTDNKNTKTFDMIECIFPLIGFSGFSSFTKKEVVQFLTPYKKTIIKQALDNINVSKRFQKYNVPIGFLKVYKMTITNDMCLVINFELKEV